MGKHISTQPQVRSSEVLLLYAVEHRWWIACAKRMPSKSRVDYNPILLLFAMVSVVKVRQNQRVSTAYAELIILTFV
jgi:hypothetical protein